MKFIRNTFVFLLVIIVSGALMAVWSFYEYTQVKVTRVSLADFAVPESFRGKKIVFAADFQYDTLTNGSNTEMLQKVVDMMNAEQPDIILLGGDYINYAQYIDETFAILGQLRAPLGIYAVTGNHDQARLERLYAAFDEYNIQNVDNAGFWINQGDDRIRIGGVEDWYFGAPDADLAIGDAAPNDFMIMLAHNPDYFEELTVEQHQHIDLTLAGHLHAGQVTAFGLFAPIIPSSYGDKYLYGMKNYDGNNIYITSGLGGNVGPMQVRFFAQPEIVVFDL
ncbi:metallophosphoesterase [Culicoidibacter larvae]|uniref:Metallophosphoesterase n=1 Tax=Culicoidibacter larvae TaxID=2579976 RepID=A0A5R8QG36_9FIRM|nr:metallophosphoesterase [Culicoidibacter larvae]TLG76726.1 metallophosphoesterase [Culicoidibacter larvae]